MEIIFIDNNDIKLSDVLNQTIPSARELKFAVAFMKYSGFNVIKDVIKKFLFDGGTAEFIVGLDFRMTEPKALRAIKSLADKNLSIKCYCFSTPNIRDTSVYHPKLYLLNNEEEVNIIIGSSNLTAGGLERNMEVNLKIKSSIKDQLVSDIYSIYYRLKSQPTCFEPDWHYIDRYEEACQIIQRAESDFTDLKHQEEIVKNLRKLEQDLPKPLIRPPELIGWMRLVYEKLPSTIFKTSDIYKYENEFKINYPLNRNIKAKIRQQLQFLRDVGLIKYIGKNKWKKIV